MAEHPSGLSPRVRGNHLFLKCLSWPTRSIPACAGEPQSTRCHTNAKWVYPRVCGGTASTPVQARRGGGLSPRVRGNRTEADDDRLRERSIPACAGEPVTETDAGVILEVYPRVCGGTQIERYGRRELSGLSPRVRGNPCTPSTWAGFFRSIPACAGEPPLERRKASGRAVYPRVCGGTQNMVYVWGHCAGLSPRVRGNHVKTIKTHRDERSIPACAGEPEVRSAATRAKKVYPRVCGGTCHSHSRSW